MTTPALPLPPVARPGDALVGVLLGDLGVPLLALAADLGDPVQVRVVDLLDLLDALHEARELLELRPLVVGGPTGTSTSIDFSILAMWFLLGLTARLSTLCPQMGKPGLRAAVVLFTRDLRVHDHPALAAAVERRGPLLPLFVLDGELLDVRRA